jgi:pilus assembly protein CpaE
MDQAGIFVLLIQKDSAAAAAIRQSSIPPGELRLTVQCVETVPTALARIGGGGIDVIILDLSLDNGNSSESLGDFLAVRQAAARVPVIVLYAPHDEALALKAMRAGAVDCLPKEGAGGAIDRAIHSAAARAQKPPARRNVKLVPPRPAGGTISFIGAKGGVGATTVALNVASALAQSSKVILVEMTPAFGTLLPHLQPHGQVRTISYLLRTEAADIAPEEASGCLWPCKAVPGLSVLFGPQTAAECREVTPYDAQRLIRALVPLADYLVLDLPAWLSDANRAAAEVSSRLILVAERDPVCVQSAKRMARAIETWEGSPQPIEMILVSRAAPVCPMSLQEIEAQLGFPALGVVPPEPDVCLAAEIAHTPLIAFRPDSLVAGNLIALAKQCASDMRAVHMVA